MSQKLLIIFLTFILFSCSHKNEEKITELSQLKDKRIAILTGSAGDIAARKAFPDAKFLDNVASADAAYSVKIGKADALIFNKSILVNIAERNPDLVVLEKPLAKVEVAAAFNKETTELLEDINAAIKQLEEDGTLKAMRQKWIESNYNTVPGMPQFSNDSYSEVLKMGTSALFEPYTFLYNNEITGFDIELGYRIGEILEKQIEIMDMTFESLIPALRSGKIDFALSDFNITEERKQFISFSIPYVVNDISVLVRK
ncbi:MAG: transporter substrate-binding domain-containing protein [Melioribacteraceae bacterium]|nr:transporter substrate-binding domain-containing protein [Melioribacteraceae bacterium]